MTALPDEKEQKCPMKRKTLTGQFKRELILLGVIIIALWVVFFEALRSSEGRDSKAMQEDNARRAAEMLSNEFAKIVDLADVCAADVSANLLLFDSTALPFHDDTISVNLSLKDASEITSLPENIIFCRDNGICYRMTGQMGNEEIERLYDMFGKKIKDREFCYIDANGEKSLVYMKEFSSPGDFEKGIIIITVNSGDIRKILADAALSSTVVAISDGYKIMVSSDEIPNGNKIGDVKEGFDSELCTEVGFTGMTLHVFYDSVSKEIKILFIVAMIIMATLLVFVFTAFLRFWRSRMFAPIQTVINEVSTFGNGNERALAPTGLEHFDVLVDGINEMVGRIWQKEREIYDKSLALQEAEIKKQKSLIVSLKKQISAHFTVNVLNSIKALAASGDSEKAGMMCDGLAYLLRYANAGDAPVSGMEEFFILDKYVGIMEIRFPNRFEWDIDIQDFLDDVSLPRMILQPVIENAIVHGLCEYNDKGGRLKLYPIRHQNGTVSYVVEDNGVGMTEEELNRLRERLSNAAYDDAEPEGLSHVALLNIQRRIRSYFGPGFGVTVESVKGSGTRVTITVPSQSGN